MAESDFNLISDALDGSTVTRGTVTSGVVPMASGGGSFAYGMNSRTTTTGSVALYTNITDYNPTAQGGLVSAAMQRGESAGTVNFAPYIFICLGGTSSADQAYILGLADADPGHVVLCKGALSAGVPDVAPGIQGVLRRSSSAFAKQTWFHLRLDAIVEPNGDVLLKVWQSDLTVHNVASPSWVAITGMSDFTDDSLGVNTGTAPFTAGRLGFGARFADVSRRVYFDEVVIERQV